MGAIATDREQRGFEFSTQFEQGATDLALGSGSKGSWAQLIASTSFRVVELVIAIENKAHGQLIDIGVGSAGSETVLLPDLLSVGINSSGDGTSIFTHRFGVTIAAGTRVVARGQGAIYGGQVRSPANVQVIVGGP